MNKEVKMGASGETKKDELIEGLKKGIEALKEQVEKTEGTTGKAEALSNLSQISNMLTGKIEKADIEEIETLMKGLEGLMPSNVMGGMLKEVDSLLKGIPAGGFISEALNIGKGE